MSIITHPPPPQTKRTFLDLPPETRIMIYKLTCSTFTVHVRPRFLTPHRQLIEQPTLVTLTNCNILSLSRQIRIEALPYVRISPAVQICRSAVVEIHQAHVARRRPPHNDESGGHGEEDTCHFLAQLRPRPCDLHQTATFTLLTSDRAAVAKYFLLGFHGIQKEDCETLTTNWMKLVEWDHHHDHVSSDATFSVRTVFPPPWWPEDVPGSLDLLSSDDRIHVLTHILLNTTNPTRTTSTTSTTTPRREPQPRSHGKRTHPHHPHPPSVTALEHSTRRHVKELQNPNALEILEEMFKVRQLMERFESGTGDDCAETILAGLGF